MTTTQWSSYSSRLRTALIAIALAFCTYPHRMDADTMVYRYGDGRCLGIALSGESLFLSYTEDDCVVEVNASTMEEVRRYSAGISSPAFILADQEGDFIYVICNWFPSSICRIDLSDGDVTLITVEGDATCMAMDHTGNRLWVVHRTWPQSGSTIDGEEIEAHRMTGRITEIDLNSYSVVRTAQADVLASSLYYSQYAEALYLMHSTMGLSNNNIGSPISVFDVSSGNLALTEEILGGAYRSDLPQPGCNWTENGSQWLNPCPGISDPDYSMRIYNAQDNSIAMELSLPNQSGDPLGVQFVRYIESCDIIWATILNGIPQGHSTPGKYIARINTDDSSIQYYPIDSPDTMLGDFAATSDGSILFLTRPWTGEVIKWTVPNTQSCSPESPFPGSIDNF